MFKKAKYFLLITGLAMSFASLGIARTQIHAASIDPKEQACQALGGASGTGSTSTCATPVAGPDVNNTLKLAINVFSLIVGFAAIIMIIVGGLKYIISSGESSNINSAKNTILYAIIGLVVVALAQVIVRFVLDKAAAPPKCAAGVASTTVAPCTP